MKIEVLCHNCMDEDMVPFEMSYAGPLYFNPDTKTQSQVYECKKCGIEVTLMVYPEND